MTEELEVFEAAQITQGILGGTRIEAGLMQTLPTMTKATLQLLP